MLTRDIGDFGQNYEIPLKVDASAHFIKNKCQHHLWEIMTTDYITHIVTNGASTIHDFEFAVEAQKLLGISLEGSVG